MSIKDRGSKGGVSEKRKTLRDIDSSEAYFIPLVSLKRVRTGLEPVTPICVTGNVLTN